MSNDPDSPRSGQLSRDPERIEEWARDHDVVPVRVSDESGGRRFRMVPEHELTDETERIEWEQFEDELDTGEEVVIYHGTDAEDPLEVRGQTDVLDEIDESDLEERLLAGETVETQITETRVVESVVVEELDLESDLVDTEVLEDRVTDVELLSLECTRCDLDRVESEDIRDWFDTERYLDAVGDVARHGESAEGARTIDDATGDIDAGDEFPYRGDLEVEETWAVTREFRERHEVDSRITGKEVTEADSIDDYEIDAPDLHRAIVDQGVFEADRPAEEDVLTHYDVESEVAGDDTIRTTFEREHVVEDEIVDRKRFDADLVNGQYLGIDLLQSRPIDEARAGGATTGEGTTVGEGTTTTGTTAGEAGTATTGAGGVEVTDDLVGRDVVDAEGDQIGVVADVEPDADALYVDADPGLTERIMTRLGWGGADEEDYRLDVSDVASITDDEVRLGRPESVEGGETR